MCDYLVSSILHLCEEKIQINHSSFHDCLSYKDSCINSGIFLFFFSAKVPAPIKITLPDGKEVEGQSWRTTPYEIAQGIRYIAFFQVGHNNLL